MSHVSRKKLLPKTYDRIASNLGNSIFSGGTRQGRTFLYSLLTKTEKIMLAKRLAMIVMLHKEYSYYRIAQVLRVSVSTARRFHKMSLAGYFRAIERALDGKKSNLTFAEELELLLGAGGILAMGPQHRKRLARLKAKRHKHGI